MLFGGRLVQQNRFSLFLVEKQTGAAGRGTTAITKKSIGETGDNPVAR